MCSDDTCRDLMSNFELYEKKYILSSWKLIFIPMEIVKNRMKNAKMENAWNMRRKLMENFFHLYYYKVFLFHLLWNFLNFN